MKTQRANAKINLYLDVISRRENGYHNIESFMHSISLCDLVSLDYKPGLSTSISLESSENDKTPTDCRNLAYRAAEKYLQATERAGSVKIYLEKHIPVSAGLAGGSTDAATVLKMMNEACGSPLTLDELCEIGVKLGADVPFCIRGGGAFVSGIGEILEPAPKMPNCYLVVSCKGEGISTPWAYGELDKRHGDFTPPSRSRSEYARFQEGLIGGNLDLICQNVYNIFEEVIAEVQPFVNLQKKIMNENGAKASMMSGSGPSVFGIFDSAKEAEDACRRLTEIGACAFVCHF